MSIWHSSGHIQGKLSIRRFPSLLWQPQDIYLNFSMAHTNASFRYLFKGLVSIINRKLILKSNWREKQPFVTFAPWWTLLSFKAQSNCHLSGFYLLHHSPSTLVTLPGLLCNYCNCSIKLMNIYWCLPHATPTASCEESLGEQNEGNLHSPAAGIQVGEKKKKNLGKKKQLVCLWEDSLSSSSLYSEKLLSADRGKAQQMLILLSRPRFLLNVSLLWGYD